MSVNPLLLEFVRQVLRWFGVWLMTIGVPENVASLTANEQFVTGVAGFVMYACSDLGWLVSFWKRAREYRLRLVAWWRQKWAR